MDILYRANWKHGDRPRVEAPNASGIRRLVLAMCAIALAVGILETASVGRVASTTVAWNVAGQESMQ